MVDEASEESKKNSVSYDGDDSESVSDASDPQNEMGLKII